MSRRKPVVHFDQSAIRRWTLYVVRFKNNNYYIGITSRKDFMCRINQHGGRTGAKVNRGKTVEEILEIHDLGTTTGLKAGYIENDMMLQYRKKYGARRVRGGYDIYKETALVPTYTPGSKQSILFIVGALILAICLVVFMAKG